jgi:hypothetical protein
MYKSRSEGPTFNRVRIGSEAGLSEASASHIGFNLDPITAFIGANVRFRAQSGHTFLHRDVCYFLIPSIIIGIVQFFLRIRFLFHWLTPHLISPGIRHFGIDQSFSE